MIIDAHQHFGDLTHSDVFNHAWLEVPEHAGICRSFLPGDLKPLMDEAGVDRTVWVQTQHHLEETRWAFSLAEEHDWIAGVVGWVDLASPDCAAQVAEFQQHPRFCGVRHITQDEPEEDFIVRQDVIGGLEVFPRSQAFAGERTTHEVSTLRR